VVFVDDGRLLKDGSAALVPRLALVGPTDHMTVVGCDRSRAEKGR
jgi:hypothetical protein